MQWIVIPYRGPAGAKTRLAGSLSEDARRQVSRAMFQHVLNVACETVGAGRVLVVTASRTAAAMARRVGAQVLKERAPGLNAAVQEACTHLRARGATTATVVAADLPLLSKSSLMSLNARASRGDVAIAVDRSGTGTNAVALPLRTPFVFKFGEDSFRLHLEQGNSRRVPVRAMTAPQLAADVDVPEDLALLADPAALSTLPSVQSAAFRGLR